MCGTKCRTKVLKCEIAYDRFEYVFCIICCCCFFSPGKVKIVFFFYNATFKLKSQ